MVGFLRVSLIYHHNLSWKLTTQQIYGYEDPNLPLGWNLSPTRQQLISSLMVLGAVIASGCAGPIAWKLGRKICLWSACVLLSIGNVIMMVSFLTDLYVMAVH